MDIDSPIGASGLGERGRQVNGVVAGASTTAKLTEMMPLYRPAKVRGPFQTNPQKLTAARSSFAETRQRQQGAKGLQLKAVYCLLILMMKGAYFSPRKATIVCKYTT